MQSSSTSITEILLAPVQIKKRNADWGLQEMNQSSGMRSSPSLDRARDPASPWIRLVEARGFDAAQRIIADLHAGKSNPEHGHVVLLV
jgi:hypothetical protein